ncbi:hypothetical protein [Blattabacterium cuenoti]|uniref:hypothetical protein n=1 Tax=Blattabacterium cuenoti TaxID=1653831 RepID=UPI00163C32E5|nr:hypothetical protein [Blattabacterium cuenoti]
MNTSIKVLIPTIFITLGFIISCNDEVTSVGKEDSDVNNNTPTTVETPSIPDPPPTIASSSPDTPPTEPPKTTTPSETPSNSESPENDFSGMDNIDPEDLSREIKEIGEKIQKLEKETEKHCDEYYQMIEVQKGILNEVKRRKMIMRSKPVGSQEQVEAQKDFEDQKKLGKERLKILKEKNILLNKLNKSITEAKNEKDALQKKQENFFNFLKKQKEGSKKN